MEVCVVMLLVKRSKCVLRICRNYKEGAYFIAGEIYIYSKIKINLASVPDQ